jgi:drug/metabolite transporter (DMT)-like permease
VARFLPTWLTGRFGKVDLLLLATAIVWGASYLNAKDLTQHASVNAMLAFRFTSGAVIMAIIAIVRGNKFSKHDWMLGALYGVAVGTIMQIETNGIKITSATNAGLIISLTIIFTPILESIWSRLWLPRMFFVAAVGAIVGVALLVSGNGFKQPNIGDALMLGAAVLRAITTTAQGKLAEGRTISSFNVTVVQLAVCGLSYLALDFGGVVNLVHDFGAQQWFEMSFLVLLCTVFGFVALQYGILRTSATRASLLLSTEPIFAVLTAALFGGESLFIVGVIGAAMIIGSSYWGLAIEAKHRLALNVDGQPKGA